MTSDRLMAALKATLHDRLPVPGDGQTALRHKRLMEIGRENLSLARLAEAHWDAVAILAEAGREPMEGVVYGVWASEIPGQPLHFDSAGESLIINGAKMFCTGAGLIDRALVTVRSPEPFLIDIDLRGNCNSIAFDYSAWKTDAFLKTCTATTTFASAKASRENIIGEAGWYLNRPGFWHGACGPAACWAGGAAGLLDWALRQSRDDPHTTAHLGAMWADVWAMGAYLDVAGSEIDRNPRDITQARIRALTARSMIEQACTDVLRRLARAYGPYPLAMSEAVSRRYAELDLYLRQSHGERDLEALGRDVRRAVDCPKTF